MATKKKAAVKSKSSSKTSAKPIKDLSPKGSAKIKGGRNPRGFIGWI